MKYDNEEYKAEKLVLAIIDMLGIERIYSHDKSTYQLKWNGKLLNNGHLRWMTTKTKMVEVGTSWQFRREHLLIALSLLGIHLEDVTSLEELRLKLSIMGLLVEK